MKKNVIVSLADSNYFELLNELVDSIKSFEKSKDTAICILDAGLSEEQKNELSKKVDEIKSADWLPYSTSPGTRRVGCATAWQGLDSGRQGRRHQMERRATYVGRQ